MTWLYGPLQANSKNLFKSTSSPSPNRFSKSNSLNKKPILKKRSASEAILQQWVSTHTLLKHAGANLQVQEASILRSCPSFGRSRSDFTPISPTLFGYSSVGIDHPSSSLSGLQLPPDRERRHIHFNNEVAQYIAVEDKEGDDDESSSDDNIMMKEVPHKVKISNRNTPLTSFDNEKPTIASLPPTLLRGDTPEPEEAEEAILQQAAACFCPSIKASSLSPPQETLSLSKPSANFLLGDDEDTDLNWSELSLGRNENGLSLQTQPLSSSELNYEPGVGLRRTPSGMFMPYEEDEDEVVAAGLLGRLVDTVNTARDITHVIWNVGWR